MRRMRGSRIALCMRKLWLLEICLGRLTLGMDELQNFGQIFLTL